MSDESLTVVTEDQPELLPIEAMELGAELLLPRQEQVERYTLARVERNQERYRGICAAVAMGLGVKRIAKAFGCSVWTVRKIRQSREADLAPLKKQMGMEMLDLARLSAEELGDRLAEGKIPANVLPIVMGIGTERGLQLLGEATEIKEVRHKVDVSDRLMDDLRAAKRAAGEVVEAEEVAPAEPSSDGPEPGPSESDSGGEEAKI